MSQIEVVEDWRLRIGKVLAAFLGSEPRVQLWFNDLCEASRGTAVVYLRALRYYAVWRGKSASELVMEAKANAELAEDSLQLWSQLLRREVHCKKCSLTATIPGVCPRCGSKLEKLAPKSVGLYVAGVKNWLDFNRITLMRRIRCGDRDSTPTIMHEPLLTNKDLAVILSHCKNPQDKVAAIAVIVSRPGAASQLTLGDLPELIIDGNTVRFTCLPTRLELRKEITKRRRKYFTFLIPEYAQCVKIWLEERLRRGERLTAESRLVGLTYSAVFFRLKRILRNAGYPYRPYILRGLYDGALMSCQRDWQQFFMGHKGEIEAVYTLNKRLPQEKIEEGRREIMKIEDRLSTLPPTHTKEERLHSIVRNRLKEKGFTDDQIEAAEAAALEAAILGYITQLKPPQT